MKLAKVLLGLMAAGFATGAMADVTIKFEDNVDLLAVNQERPDAKSDGFFSSGKTVTMPNGENQIVFRYEPFFEEGNERVSVNSEVIIAKFNAADANLTFELPKFRDARTAKKEINPLNWSLVDENGQAVELKEDTLVRHGYQPGRDYPREADEYNRKGGVAALTLATVTLPAAQAAEVQKKAQQATDSTAEEMLHFWYEKADAETKARFKAYVNQQ